MISAVEDPETCLIYRPSVRNYYLPVIEGCLADDVRPWGPDNLLLFAKADGIDFCPFCGTKLPSSLKAEWQRRIAEAGYDPNDEDLPENFLSDRWWKNERL